MLEYLYLAKWEEAFGFLASGSPPIYVRLVALNALFLALFGIRRAVGANPMSGNMVLFVQLAVLGTNLLVLFQPEVEAYLRVLTDRF